MMTISEMAKKLDFQVLTKEVNLEAPVKNGFVGDLLSVVMGEAEEGCAWVTVQSHLNIIAVAVLVNAACIIVSEGSQVEPEALRKAEEEGVPVLSTTLSSYAAVKAMVTLGIE